MHNLEGQIAKRPWLIAATPERYFSSIETRYTFWTLTDRRSCAATGLHQYYAHIYERPEYYGRIQRGSGRLA